MINAIGIPSKGVAHFVEKIIPLYAALSTPLVISISAPTADGFACLARDLSLPGVAAIEANISCPNIEEDGKAFAMNADSTAAVTRALRAATDLPLWIKLTPNTGDMPAVARAGKPRERMRWSSPTRFCRWRSISRRSNPASAMSWGLSGPAVKPIVLRHVFQCANAVDIPIIGCGGISSADDVVEYMLAGARAVQVGTATFLQPNIMPRIIEDLQAFCYHRQINRVSDLTGALLIEEADESDLSWLDPQ
uniref:nitronate monooxygenase n=1 Tax=Neorhizobium sp. EC2-8 TaxID=3129230 RepID=UPI00310152F9